MTISAMVFLVGLIIGSFLNVCIYRIPRGESINWPPSHCPNCGEGLKPVDLIPVLSYLFLKGRCRTCQNSISIAYPAIELLNGILYVMLYLVYGLTPLMGVYALVTSVLLVISKIDLETQTIPNRLNAVIFILGVIALFIKGFEGHLLNQTFGFLVGGGFFLALAVLTNGAMGGGDIKLMAALGWLLGWISIIEVTLISFVIGAFISLGLLILKIKGRKDYIPFGPFIALAALITLLWGEQLVSQYIQWMTGS